MKQRILLVEDEQSLCETIKLNLELEGYVVQTAKDGKTALKVFNGERFNLVILGECGTHWKPYGYGKQ